MSDEEKKNMYKYNLRKKILFLVVIVLFVIVFIYIFPKLIVLNENKNILKFCEKTPLTYIGKTKYIRQNYNALLFDDSKIFIAGKGEENISKKAEIFDLNKKKVIKTINLSEAFDNDYLYLMPNGNILKIGKAVEIINTKNYQLQKLNVVEQVGQALPDIII